MGVNAIWQASEGTFAQLTAGEVEFVSDLDASAGGKGLAPTPHQMLDGALAACTALTLQLYSQRKQYPLESASVDVSHESVAGVYRMTRQVRLVGALTEAQRVDLLRVANACPVHKTLLGEIEIATQLLAKSSE